MKEELVVDVREVMLRMGYTIFNETANSYITRPLYRDSDNNTALAVDKKTGVWFDFVERIGGSLSTLVEKTLSIPVNKATEFLQDRAVMVMVSNNYELDEVKRFDKQLLLKLKKDHSYWVSRGIPEDTVKIFEGGTTNNGRMKFRYVFPIFDVQNHLVGFSGRSLVDNPLYPKWKILGKKSKFLFPCYTFQNKSNYHKQAIIVESIGDMLSLVELGIVNVIVAFGVEISSAVIQFLLKQDCQRIILLMNNDEENNSVGNRAAEEQQKYLNRFFDATQITNIVPPFKDLNTFLALNKSAFEDFCNQMELYV